MTHVEVRCRCGGEIRFEPIDDVPDPPFRVMEEYILDPRTWRGWRWVCAVCGADCGVTLDYGTLDLGIVRDAVRRDRPGGDFEIFEAPS